MTAEISDGEAVFLQMLPIMSPMNGRIVELGTYRGKSTIALCRGSQDYRVFTIDNWIMQHHGENNRERAIKNIESRNFYPRLLTGESTIVPNCFRNSLTGVALLFIDTDHTPEMLKNELEAWKPYLLSYAVIAMHDYGVEKYKGYTEFIDEYFKNEEKVGQIESLIAFRIT